MRKIDGSPEVVLFIDGASRGNPGPGAVGAVLYSSSGQKINEISRYVGETTNNVAEYLALIYGLQEAFFAGAERVSVNTDSQLVARQLKGTYKVRDAKMKVFFDIAKNLFRGFQDVSIHEIPREKNSEADSLANQALDSRVLF
ncbi:MAG TPA: ribonuclease HI family protein [Candidatus Omnitrophota bacterium]|nr:ribonuclease HI family protein [Candidatus Omnitrophota bacterium]